MYEFNGYDWTELAEAWGIPLAEGDNDDAVNAAAIRAYMRERTSLGNADVNMVADLRTFLVKLIEEEQGYSVPLWRGVLAIEDDWTFVRYCSVLLEFMWN